MAEINGTVDVVETVTTVTVCNHVRIRITAKTGTRGFCRAGRVLLKTLDVVFFFLTF